MSKVVTQVFSLMLLRKKEIPSYSNLEELKWNYFSQIDSDKCLRCGVVFDDVCYNCSEFGSVNRTDVFIKMDYVKYKKSYKYSHQNINLTKLQKQASIAICKSIKNNKDILIWAVCGAGKTEICFEAIELIIAQGEYVCFAIPRIDVLYDVYERLVDYFDTDVVILNSGEPKLQYGQIFVMTTNQLLKFHSCFSLIIVDEVDAFPFEQNPKFNNAVHNSKREGAIAVYLTSTPSDEIKLKLPNQFIIYERWHKFNLPVPYTMKYDIKKFNQNLIPFGLYVYLVISSRPKLLFISNRHLAEKIALLLQKTLNSKKIDYVHSQDVKRKDKISDFKLKKTQILVTTTILERGVTFMDCDVIVLDACSSLYNKASLIQIAGRVGRKKEYQSGKVFFLYKKKTKVIKQAIKEIKLMNKMKKISEKNNK